MTAANIRNAVRESNLLSFKARGYECYESIANNFSDRHFGSAKQGMIARIGDCIEIIMLSLTGGGVNELRQEIIGEHIHTANENSLVVLFAFKKADASWITLLFTGDSPQPTVIEAFDAYNNTVNDNRKF